ncbi:MAG TPA: dienelactone hydrolase family protein [Steroidobacteraceae bacterium]|nr:dienelactone hydrolase family protein [Steroidobacteraceae bacterium]
MCDNDAFDDMIKYGSGPGALTRRQFGALGVGAGVASLLPISADAADVKGSDVEIKTPDGTCDAYFVHPTKGRHPAVLVWPDIFGLRPAFKQMGERLAGSGYSVLVPNPFYRKKKAPTAPANPDFNDPATRGSLMGLMGSLTADTMFTDARAFVPWLDKQRSVDPHRKMGTTGYCMGGPFVFRTAAAFPERIGGGATFHGAGLVTKAPDSPHLLVPKIKAHFLIAIAESDDMQQPEAKDVLRAAFAKAENPAEVEVYTGTKHGWCPPDSRVYDHDQAEHAWTRLLATFKTALA